MVEHLAVGACLGDRLLLLASHTHVIRSISCSKLIKSQPLLLKPLLLLIAAALLASYERFRIIECAKTLPM